MDRVTQKDVRAAFARAFSNEERAANFSGTDNRHNVGKLALDYAACYGGWTIVSYSAGDSGRGSAQSQPFGSTRRPSREMLAYLRGIADGRELPSRVTLSGPRWQ